jgi:branched-chain amino acid transport system permease protein
MLAVIWSGIVTGCLYALGALGLVMIYKSSKVINFAHGNLAGLAAFCVFGLTAEPFAWPWWAGSLAAVGIAMLIALLAWAVITPIVHRSDLTAAIATLGIGLVLQGATLLIFGSKIVNLELPISRGSFTWLGLRVTSYDTAVVLATAAIVAALFLIVDRTRIGIAFRATANNPFASRVCGLRVPRIHLFSWLTGAFLGVASALLIVPTTFLSSTTVASFMLQAFAAAVIGGFTSLPGSIIGGILVGVVVNVFTVYVSSEFLNTFLLFLILGALGLFPEGILSKMERSRG